MENLEKQATKTNEIIEKVTETFVPEDKRDEFEQRVEEVSSMSKDEFEAQIKALEEQNKALQKQQALLKREQNKSNVVNELNKRDLGAFTKVFDIVFDNFDDNETLVKKVDAIEQAVNNILVSKSFVPKETAQQDAYNQAISEGNVNQALTHKLGKLFGIK